MGILRSSLGARARFGTQAAAICAIVFTRKPAKGHHVADRVRLDEDEEEFEPHLYSEYAFPFGQTVDLRTRSRRGRA